MPARDRRHYTGSYKVRAKAVREAAYADPGTRCRRCGRTLAEEQTRHDKRVTWQAGHTVDGNSSYPLVAEHSTCNQAAGGSEGSKRKQMRPSRRWY